MAARRIISLFVLAAFAAFEWSCITSGAKPVRMENAVARDISQVDPASAKTKIFRVVKKDGKKILFPQENPGRFDPATKAVVGVALQQFVFAKAEVAIVRDEKKDVVRSVTTGDGRFYEVLSSLDEGDNIRVNAYAPISIAVSEIQTVFVVKPSAGGGVFTAIVAIAGAAAVGYLAYLAIKPLLNLTKDPTIR
jgi:hypothetical protein